MAKYTAEDAFRKSAIHCLTQKRKCMIPDLLANYHCANVNAEGEQCAYSCLLPKERFQLFGGTVSNMGQGEDFMIELAREGYDMALKGPLTLTQRVMYEMVEVHDLYKVKNWKEKILQVGEKYAFDRSFLEGFE